jgi:hypothetical protein
MCCFQNQQDKSDNCNENGEGFEIFSSENPARIEVRGWKWFELCRSPIYVHTESVQRKL